MKFKVYIEGWPPIGCDTVEAVKELVYAAFPLTKSAGVPKRGRRFGGTAEQILTALRRAGTAGMLQRELRETVCTSPFYCSDRLMSLWNRGLVRWETEPNSHGSKRWWAK